MDGSGIGAGLAALAFWGFIAAVVVGGMWYDIRRRQAQQETVRQLIASGQPIDHELIDKLTSLGNSGSRALDVDFKVTALWILPVAVGLAIFALVLGYQYPEALFPLLGAAALLGCLGIGFWIACVRNRQAFVRREIESAEGITFVQDADDDFAACPEVLVVSLARTGDRSAFEELVRRRQSQVRNLMRRFCDDAALADDLAQQVFLQVWLKIRTLRKASAFGAWMKRLAISVWLQHRRKKDVLHGASEFAGEEHDRHDQTGMGMDLDRALATLPDPVKLCIVLSYQEGMSHPEIAELTDMPLGTVKSHISRGTQKLRQLLDVYGNISRMEKS